MPQNFERKNQEVPEETLRKIAQNPTIYLERNFEKGAKEAIIFLIQARNLISKSQYIVENPDSYFKQFYVAENAEENYYTALCLMLKCAGFDRLAVESALMDMVPVGSTSDESPIEYMRKYVSLTKRAVEKVYGEE